MNAARLTVEIQRVCAADTPADAELRRWLELALGAVNGEVTLRIVDEAESAELNGTYRDKPRATNVLAFGVDPLAAVPSGEAPPLGDIVVCAPVVEREAREQRKTAAAHWAHLVIHGALHLAGYDHDNAPEAEVMERRERELLAELGIADPYLLACREPGLQD